MKWSGQASARLAAAPDAVFATITDLSNRPPWNERLAAARFTGRSHVIELDQTARRFIYRSMREDANPSFTIWTWEVEPDGEGSRVILRWELRPATVFDKRVAAPLRQRVIERKEAPVSLVALAQVCR